jgi:hypothetical protein
MYDQELLTDEMVLSPDQEIPEEEMVRAVYELAAEQMNSGASKQQVRALLLDMGLDRESASIVISNLSRARSDAGRQAGRKDMLHGALWCIGGSAVTLVTYMAASGGGTYFIAWGAIILGAIQFFRGLVRWIRH